MSISSSATDVEVGQENNEELITGLKSPTIYYIFLYLFRLYVYPQETCSYILSAAEGAP